MLVAGMPHNIVFVFQVVRCHDAAALCRGRIGALTKIEFPLILALIGALPTWGYSRSWGYGPGGGLGLVIVLTLTGHMTDWTRAFFASRKGGINHGPSGARLVRAALPLAALPPPGIRH